MKPALMEDVHLGGCGLSEEDAVPFDGDDACADGDMAVAFIRDRVVGSRSAAPQPLWRRACAAPAYSQATVSAARRRARGPIWPPVEASVTT